MKKFQGILLLLLGMVVLLFFLLPDEKKEEEKIPYMKISLEEIRSLFFHSPQREYTVKPIKEFSDFGYLFLLEILSVDSEKEFPPLYGATI